MTQEPFDVVWSVLIVCLLFCLFATAAYASFLRKLIFLMRVESVRDLPDGRYSRGIFLGYVWTSKLYRVERFEEGGFTRSFTCLYPKSLPPLFSMKDGRIWEIEINRETLADLGVSNPFNTVAAEDIMPSEEK